MISVKVGAVLKTKLPALPVIPFTDNAKFADVIEFVRFFEPSVATSLFTVRPPTCKVPVPSTFIPELVFIL